MANGMPRRGNFLSPIPLIDRCNHGKFDRASLIETRDTRIFSLSLRITATKDSRLPHYPSQVTFILFPLVTLKAFAYEMRRKCWNRMLCSIRSLEILISISLKINSIPRITKHKQIRQWNRTLFRLFKRLFSKF